MKNVVYYSQYDPRWAGIPYTSPGNPDATIQSSGCGPSCFAMLHATYTDPKFSPVESCQLAISLHDRVTGGTEDEFFKHAADHFGYQYSDTTDTAVAISALKADKLVICHMEDWFRPGCGHFIVARGMDGDKILINDPASRANTAKSWDQSVFRQKCLKYFIISKKEAVKVDYDESLKFLAQKCGISVDYWEGRKSIDQYFEAFVMKVANAWKGEAK